MIRLFALLSFVYQSAAAVVLIFTLSHILSPIEYTAFSLALASSQLLCVLMFEWLQLAGVRLLAAATGEDAARLRTSLLAAALLCALALLLIGSAFSLAGPLAPTVVALGLTLAVLQGLADMQIMTIRISNRLGTAAMLLILRASLLLGGATAGAHLYGTTEAALFGSISGQAAALLMGLIVHRMPLKWISLRRMIGDWGDFSRYGIPAAAASVIHLSVPVVLRFTVIGSLGTATPSVAAGFSMAIDLLQRPFAVLVAAIHTMSYPEVIVQFEQGTPQEGRQATARLFDFILCATVVMLGGLIGFLPDAGRLFVPPDILSAFLNAAPVAAAFYFVHTHLQSTLAVVPHLRKSAVRLVVVAAAQLMLVWLSSVIGAARGYSPAEIIASAAAATAIVILFASGPIIQFGAMPRWLLAFASSAAAVAIGAFAAVPSEPLIWLAGKIVVSAIAVVLIAWWGGFLVRHEIAPQSGTATE